MITQILIKQEKEKSENFYMHVRGEENYSSFAFKANTVDALRKAVSGIIKEHSMASSYTIGVTETKKIQVILKKVA
jgi:hypothetical protein